MDSEQPYRPPASDVGGVASGISGGSAGLTPGGLDALRKTRPWVLLMGIMILLACALLLLAAVVSFAIGSFMPGDGPVGMNTLGVVYLIMAGLYLYPAIRLLRFAGAIGRIRGTDEIGAVEDALRQQLAFWRFMGIVSLAVIGVCAAVFVLVGIASSMRGG